MEKRRAVFGKITLLDQIYCRRWSSHPSAYAFIEGADAVAILTEWDEFRALDLGRMNTLLKTPLLIDLLDVYRSAEAERHGLVYTSIGRVR